MSSVLQKRHNLQIVGVYESGMDCIKGLGFSFQILKPLNRNDARRIVVDCVEEFINELNHDEEIRPYLKNYPY